MPNDAKKGCAKNENTQKIRFANIIVKMFLLLLN